MTVTRATLTELISRRDQVAVHAIGRALVHLLNRQTREEQTANSTRVLNCRGFTSADARQGSIHARYWLKHQTLQEWQVAYWRKPDRRGTPRLAKYWRQLAEEAKRKQNRTEHTL
jgi:hypothetical protein